MIWVGIIGAKGYFGEALAKLVAGHPEAQVSTLMDFQGFGDGGPYIYGSRDVKPGYWSMMNAVKKSDIIFNGLPGGLAWDIYANALSHGKRVIDISEEHNTGSFFKAEKGNAYPGSVYGLSEYYRDKMKDASIVSNPSSYCAGAVLGLAPLAADNLVDMNSAAIESKSGIASLRRTDKLLETDITDNCGIKMYKIDGGFYAKEVNEQMVTLFGRSTAATYTPYIIPGVKGITTTIKVGTKAGMNGTDIADIYREFYKTNPFIEVCRDGVMLGVKSGFNKCFCKIGALADYDTGKITVTTVLNDALRGVASQAIQSMNLMCGIDGKIGL